MKNKKILITGGAGFIGNRIADSFLRKGFSVHVIDDLSTGKIQVLDKKISLYKISIIDFNKLEEIFKKVNPDTVVHLAAKHYIPYCNDHVTETVSVNVQGTLNIIQLMAKYKNKRLIFASSAAVYQPSLQAHKETDKLEPIDIYGATKKTGEHIIKILCPRLNINYTIFRLFNVFGPNDFTPHLIPTITNQIKKGNNIIKLGNLTSKRDYVWVDDVARAIKISIFKKQSYNQIYNIGTGNIWSVLEIFNQINQILGKKLILKSIEDKKRKIDTPVLRANITKIKRDLGWRPKVDLLKGLCLILKINQK